MKTPKINAKKLAAALAPLALAGAVMAPIAAASTPPSAHSPAATKQVQDDPSRTFHIVNESNHTIELLKFTGHQEFDGLFPAFGSRVPPGGHADFTLKDSTQYDADWTTAWYGILDDHGNVVGTFEVYMVVPKLFGLNGQITSYSDCSTHGFPRMGCTADPAGVWDWAPAKPIRLYEW